MSDFREIEIKSSRQSLVISIIIGLAMLLILLITFKFEETYPRFQPIEIAMNFGNTAVGQGMEEPMPSETQETSSAASAQSEAQSASSTMENVVTETTTETRPSAAPTPSPKPKNQSSPQTTTTPQPKGDEKGAAALQNLLGGKGKNPSPGDGNDGVPGNVGDPRGSDSDGGGIGENWLSIIPEPQKHDCPSSGVIVVDIVVNANGGIKSATPGARGSTSNDPCLRNKAKSLVEQYVRARPGSDGRTGSYRVNLR